MATPTSDEQDDISYAKRTGERLRAIRRQKGMSLHDVEAGSAQEFKASVLGAYERGERAISVPRLQRLAAFYNVPVDQLLPRVGGIDLDLRDEQAPPVAGRTDHEGNVTIDLVRLEALPEADSELLGRYLSMIQVQRQDFNGRVLTIRRDDMRALACLLENDAEALRTRLDDLGLRV